MDEYQNNFAEWNKPEKKKVLYDSTMYNSGRCKLIYINSKHTSGHLG